ncbi:nuclear transcription factor Y subunit B-like [Prosopis cineraria]|uniref:nuclear transcription factor Y subunit B-like n=1 Tax=Prosopis cineraria TaxID=364024 RepID=UPI00240F3CFD|nr:nuclear transcription factor Y subunit B-like [Prosopis cineraria]
MSVPFISLFYEHAQQTEGKSTIAISWNETCLEIFLRALSICLGSPIWTKNLKKLRFIYKGRKCYSHHRLSRRDECEPLWSMCLGTLGMEDERLLPIANVGRIMRQILPASAKISKEGKQTMQECATEFISFVTEEASDKCHRENRKTVNGDDICWALSALGFDNYAEAIARYLHKYRQAERDKIINNHKSKAHAPLTQHVLEDSSARKSSSQAEKQRPEISAASENRVPEDKPPGQINLDELT